MGQNSKKRREAKKRREERRPSGARATGGRRDARTDPVDHRIETLVLAGARAAAAGDEAELEDVCLALTRCCDFVGRSMVTSGVGLLVSAALAAVWEGGWQPREVVRHVRRRRRGDPELLVAAAMGARDSWGDAIGTPVPQAWAAQLDELGVRRSERPGEDWLGAWLTRGRRPLADALAVVLEALGVLAHMPVIEPLLAVPSTWAAVGWVPVGVHVDPPVLATIRALLAKAESSDFEAESEALTAKAQELMARHAIDDALARSDGSTRETPTTRRLAVDDPYAAARSRLLQVVAEANGGRCVWYEDLAMMAVVGYGSDLDAIEVLYTSLLVQGSRTMLARGPVTDHRGVSRTRSFRQSFLLAYAGRIRERLVVAATRARRAAEHELATDLLPVLASRDDQVDDAVTRMFPRLVQVAGPAATNAEGWRAGRTAAELATLGPEQAHLGGVAAAG